MFLRKKSYLRHHKEIIVLKNKYESFNTLMNHNKSLKLKDRLSIREIENITTLSKSSYYRIHKEIIKKGNSYWTNYYKKNSTKPINFKRSKIIDYFTPMEYYEKCKKNEVSFSQMY